MTLVDDHVHPFDLAQHMPILDDEFIRRQKDMELLITQILRLGFAYGRWTLVENACDGRRPFLKLIVPVGQGAVSSRQSSTPFSEGAYLTFPVEGR